MSYLAKISAVVITQNEEEHIGACICSLMPVVDEVVVVDSHSTDRTVSIAKSHGAVVLSVDWQGYAATKNRGNEAAKYTFILSIDADEVLSEDLQKSIAEKKQRGLNPQFIYQLNRRNYYCGQWIRYAGWYPDAKVRLFDKHTSKWEGEVHEQLAYTEAKNTVQLAGDLFHYSIKDKEDHIARLRKYNKLAKPIDSVIKAYLSALATFVKLYITKRGCLDGKLGFQLCYLSAKGKIWRLKKHLR